MNRSNWWIWSAGLVAILMVALAVGNLVDDDGGPLYGQLLFAAVLIGGAVSVAVGIKMRADETVRSSWFIGFGVLPGCLGIALFWFPPAVAAGLLAMASAIAAFRDAAAPARAV